MLERTVAITGGFVALSDAIENWCDKERWSDRPSATKLLRFRWNYPRAAI